MPASVLGGVILFGIPETKDEMATGAYADERYHAVCGAHIEAGSAQGCSWSRMSAIASTPAMAIAEDRQNGDVDNDSTLEWLAKTAVSHATGRSRHRCASDMMDGRVAAIRQELDASRSSCHARHVVRGKVCVRILRTVS